MKFLLFLLSFFNRSGCLIKNWLYKNKILTPKKAPLPLISVGSIALGGTGKTPLVITLMSYLIQHGFKPALISRGYKGRWEKSGGILSDGKSILARWEDSGDEPFMVAQNIPRAGIFIGKNRLLSCQKAKSLGFELAVLDDGFQHRRLHRDLDIVLYTPGERIAYREPVSSLKRADMILMKKGVDSQRKRRMMERFPEPSVFVCSVKNKGFFRLTENKIQPGENLGGKKVLAFCGIARPERFLSILHQGGIKPLFFFKFPDHHPYPKSSVEKITDKYKKIKAEAIITTEKDALKVIHNESLKKIPAYYLKIDLDVEDNFFTKISNLLQNWA
ncbi:MAG: tetraacyldisaccharide 4'-kinase [Candidatus Aminicenantes bacterium]|nr:tetraacyldisaccharide 4'-kinase [Candidatus Aminicenantes bacterium]